jgi:hypothetical protein
MDFPAANVGIRRFREANHSRKHADGRDIGHQGGARDVDPWNLIISPHRQPDNRIVYRDTVRLTNAR